MEAERGERMKLQHLVQTGSLPDDAKVGLSTISVINNGPIDTRVPLAPPAMVPPPPPPPGAPPPPPAPGNH